MANPNFGDNESHFDSYVDVVFESLIRGEDFVEGNYRVYDRLEALEAAGGEHFFRLGSFGDFSDLVIGDYPEDFAVAFPGRQLREAVIQRGHKLSHYVIDIVKDQMIVVNTELRVDPRGRIVCDSNTPAHFTQERESSLSVVARRAGNGYNTMLGKRILAMDLFTDDVIADTFIAETDDFVKGGAVHSRPQVKQVVL
jgi:hypothetical protein